MDAPRSRPAVAFTVVCLLAALGCANRATPTAVPRALAAGGHGYALLYELLGQERKVAQLLYIKEEHAQLEILVDAIAETCDTAHQRLEEFAAQDPRLDLLDTGLPAAEVRTREMIATARRDRLLTTSGREFERQLLWAQNEALTYASHLADTLSRSEPDPARLAFVRALWKDLTRLHNEVEDLLRRPVRAGA